MIVEYKPVIRLISPKMREAIHTKRDVQGDGEPQNEADEEAVQQSIPEVPGDDGRQQDVEHREHWNE